MTIGRWLGVALALCLVAPGGVAAELELPQGLSARVYVTGQGFDSSADRRARGIPATSTLAFDHGGTLYLARVGRRYMAGEAEDLRPVYRIPPGGAQLTPTTEARYVYGPPLSNPQIGGIRNSRELFVTTFDRERKIGVLYRVVDGRAELYAGGTPDRGTPALLRQPEGVAVDAMGNVYIADRERGAIVKLSGSGRVLDPQYVAVTRPRALTVDGAGSLWIGSDGGAEAPWQEGPGEIWQVSPEGVPRVVLRGPVAQALAVSPGGHVLVADRHASQVFALTPDGSRLELLRFTANDVPRSLAFAPVTPETRRAGIAGDLFVVVVRSGAWPVNEVLQISGPLDEQIRARRAR